MLKPDWAADGRVRALMSTREGGVSVGPFESFNLGRSWGDDADAVTENRRRFATALGAEPRWLKQVHGARVVRLTREPEATPPEADASITTEPGVACAVLVADCLPVLFAAPGGHGVGAAHAGWRGLAAGVLEATVAALSEAAGCEPEDLVAWLGPCIGPQAFEVGVDVLEAFGQAGASRFVPRPRPDGSPRWLADLPALARDRLAAAGVSRVSGGAWCTVSDPSRFFSYRRDRVCGHLAGAVVIGS